MIVVYPFSPVDQDLAAKNAEWITELGGCHGHDVFMLYDQRCIPGIVAEVTAQLMASFDHLHTLQAGAIIDGWPTGANYMFRTATATLQSKPYKCFLWLEPDAIPLKAGWLDMLEEEYKRAGRLFMGDRVHVENIPLHMSGVGIYPNPLHQYAGEAYRAHDEAWDMAARNQITPHAHFTKLIEHAWKHPKFTSNDELRTQMRPECVLFHSSKDGSLIDLLRGGQPVSRQAHNLETVGSIPTPATISGEVPVSGDAPAGNISPGIASPGFTCDIFIRTYPGDYPWLAYCLKAIQKYARGFRKIWIVSPSDNPFAAFLDPSAVEWKKVNEESEDGYLSQQIHKLYADVLTDYQADFYVHIDSDVILTRETHPEDFLQPSGFSGEGKLERKPIWYFTPYSQVETPWQPITEKFMGRPIANEFMRRFPIIVPRWLYPRLREFAHKQHGVILSQYVRNQPQRAFSEFNALGAYAYEFHRERFNWVDTLQPGGIPSPLAKQYFSWGGITPEIKSEIEGFLEGGELSVPTAAAIPTAAHTDVNAALQSNIKELPNGIWVIKDDTHISKWVELQGRLDHDQNTLPFVLPLIKDGDVVIDAGAFIGDHTIAYSRVVGEKGVVHAFEPNPVACECFLHNLHGRGNVILHNTALANYTGSMPLSGNNNNHGGCYAGEHMKVADVAVDTLDGWFYRAHVDFIKLDIEGCELMALQGAEKLIERCRPVMVIEVNQEALRRQRAKPEEIYAWLDSHGYSYSIMQENCDKSSLLYDIICTPEVAYSGPAVLHPGLGQVREVAVVTDSPPPVFDLGLAIERLAAYAADSADNRKWVMQTLSSHGLRFNSPTKKRKK